MDQDDLIAQFRAQVGDEAVPYLWAYEEVQQYVIDAQDMFARLTGGIADVTVPLADIGSPQTRLQDLDLVIGEPYTALSPYILRFIGGRLLTAKWDITFANQADLRTMRWNDYGWNFGAQLDDTETGDARYALLGIRDHYVRWMKVPNATDTCRLQFRRLPYPRIAVSDDALEIDEEHHFHLIKWMKTLAYAKEDSETYDKRLSELNEASFRSYCNQARQENDGRRFRHRVVQYGGL